MSSLDEQLLLVEVTKEVDGLEMGVLSDGTSYLSLRGLARISGIAQSTLSEFASAWLAGKRESRLARWLVGQGVDRESLYVKTAIPGVAGNTTYAYPEDICALILEYYGFEVPNPNALKNYRTIARAGLRLFIYTAVGYDPGRQVPAEWKEFHDRLRINSVPIGYFSVFRELSDFILAAIRRGLRIDHRTVPDISVGHAWAKFWIDNDLATRFGDRMRHDHNYPLYFPQAGSNPQPIWIYPLSALGEFRIWMQQSYVPERFPKYLESKIKQGILPASTAELLLLEITSPEPSQLPHR